MVVGSSGFPPGSNIPDLQIVHQPSGPFFWKYYEYLTVLVWPSSAFWSLWGVLNHGLLFLIDISPMSIFHLILPLGSTGAKLDWPHNLRVPSFSPLWFWNECGKLLLNIPSVFHKDLFCIDNGWNVNPGMLSGPRYWSFRSNSLAVSSLSVLWRYSVTNNPCYMCNTLLQGSRWVLDSVGCKQQNSLPRLTDSNIYSQGSNFERWKHTVLQFAQL